MENRLPSLAGILSLGDGAGALFLVPRSSMKAVLVALGVPVGILPGHWCLCHWVVWCALGAVDGDLGAVFNF